MPRKGGLGKGLDALIPGGEFSAQPAPTEAGISLLPVGQIQPNPRQPRSHFDPEELTELSDSIREHGVIQPVLVTKGAQAGQYTLIAGERRWMAAKQAGLESIPAIVREASQQELVELALIENVQRADLSPLETAEAYRQLAEDFDLPHEQIAARVGKSRAAVTNTLRLLKLPPAVLEELANDRITEGHARALLALPTPQAQTAALHTILRNGLNVRQTEELVRKLTGQKPAPVPRKILPPELSALEEKLRAGLGTRVSLYHGKKGGTVTIHYYSDEELDALVQRILQE